MYERIVEFGEQGSPIQPARIDNSIAVVTRDKVEFHTGELRQELKEFTKEMRKNGYKGMVMLDYTDIKDMIAAVKNKNFIYEWIPQNEASRIKHYGIREAMASMNTGRDCVFVCSLVLGVKHLYVNCIKIRDI